MADCKQEVITALERRLAVQMDLEQIETVTQELLLILSSYDVVKAETSLVTYENINEAILKEYCACLLIEGKSKKTVAQYKRTAEKFAEAIRKHYTETQISDIRMFLAMQRANGLSDRTIENVRANLSAFFQWMTREDYIDKNPCVNVAPVKYTQKIRLPFSEVEIDALRSACKNDKERALIELLLSSGVRVAELCDLRISDVSFEDMSVKVRNGKGGKSRTTYMNDLAKTHLLKYLMGRPPTGDYLFYSKGKTPIQPGGVRFLLKQLGERAGVSNVHPHRFRRTFASGLARRGMDIQEVRKLLGHSRLDTTLEYVYTSEEQIKISYKKYIA